METITDRLEEAEILDRPVEMLDHVADTVLPEGNVKDIANGTWLGHPLHPLLTDLPIGFWTSAFFLDFARDDRAQRAADVLIGLGVLSAAPTAFTGVADWSDLGRPDRRTGIMHAVCNATATALYGASWIARKRGKRSLGLGLSLAGATAATLGGFLGGHLAFRRAAGVNHAADAPTTEGWTPITTNGPLAELDGAPLVTFGRTALYDKCSHQGGPLHEGKVEAGCVECPWHGSRFRTDDGSIERGPATAPQPTYDLRSVEGRAQARRRS